MELISTDPVATKISDGRLTQFESVEEGYRGDKFNAKQKEMKKLNTKTTIMRRMVGQTDFWDNLGGMKRRQQK